MPKSRSRVRKSAPSTAPVNTQALLAKAMQLHQAGELEDAAPLYRRVLAAEPDRFDALQLLGILEAQSRRPAEAVVLLLRATALNPGDAGAQVNLGNALRSVGRLADALVAYDRAVSARPSDVDVLYNRGAVLLDLERAAEALGSFDAVLRVAPAHVDAGQGRGNALRLLSRPGEALAAYDRALGVRINSPAIWVDRGIALSDLGRHADALESFAKAQTLAPDFASAHLSEGLSRLLLGDASGWKKYSLRWRMPTTQALRRDFAQPEWRGEPIAGKTLLLHGEQGFGDTLHFCRYATLIAAQGATVIVEVQPALAGLLQGLDGAQSVLPRGAPLPPFDVHISMLDAPAVFATPFDAVPAAVPYVHADPVRIAQWRTRLGTAPARRVGIVWSGSRTLQHDQRATRLTDLDPLRNSGAELVSLQKEVSDADRSALAARPDIRDVGATLGDFGDTAAAIACLDLVITIDTAVAHLAGAMGKPVWILLPYYPTWRWLLERSDSPWYPTARLFRQTTLGDWSAPVASVATALRELVSRS